MLASRPAPDPANGSPRTGSTAIDGSCGYPTRSSRSRPFRWQHIPERLLNRADADLATMAEADFDNISIVVAAAKRHSDLLARNLAFFDQAEAGTDASNADAIETLRRLRAWELHNAGLAWRDIEVPVRWVGAVDAHLTNLQQYLEQRARKARSAYLRAVLRRVPDCSCAPPASAPSPAVLALLYDTRSTAAANMQATIGAEAAAAVMGHYMKRKRTIKANYAGPDRAYRGAVVSRRAWPTPETNATKQPTGQRITRVRRMSVGLGGVSSAPTGNGQAAG